MSGYVLGQIKQDLKRLLPWEGHSEMLISMEKESPSLQDEVSAAMFIILVSSNDLTVRIEDP